MVPVKIGVGSLRKEEFQVDGNNERLREELEFIDEKREQAMMRNTAYKQCTARYFDRRVKERKFKVGDLVLRRVFQNTKEISVGTLGQTWEGQYKVAVEFWLGIYKLAIMRGLLISMAGNVDHLNKYY